MKIDDSKPLYLITWSPDPSMMPNCDFEMQHEYNINIIADFCKGCDVALWCVEASQMEIHIIMDFIRPHLIIY